MVSNLTISFMIIAAGIAILIPIAILIYHKRNSNIAWRPIFVGVLIFIVFSQILGKIFNVYWLSINSTTAEVILQNTYIYAIYGGISAALFEETGRFVAFYLILKKYREWKDGLSYGIGHGGIEALIIGVLAAVQNISTSVMINSGVFENLVNQSGENSSSFLAIKEQLIGTPSYMFLLIGLERVSVFFIQIALSLLILYGIKIKKPAIFVLGAMIIHTLINSIPLIFKGLEFSIFLTEGFIVLVGILSIIVIGKIKLRF